MTPHTSHVTAACGPSVLLAMVLAMCITAAHGQERRFAKPELSIRVAPVRAPVQGQIIQSVRLDSAYPFDELQLDLPPVNDAVVVTLVQPTVRRFISWGVEGFSYETARAIFPKGSGAQVLGPVSVHGATVLDDGTKQTFTRRGEPVTLTVAPRAGRLAGDPWLVASNIKMTETWSKQLMQLRVGDTVTREITVVAEGATAEHLPTLEQGGSTGMTVLRGTEKRHTEILSTGVRGRLVQSFDLTIDSDQVIDIRPVRLAWWDSKRNAARSSLVPFHSIEPLPRDVSGLISAAMSDAQQNRRRGALGLLALLGAMGAALWWALPGSGRRHDRRLMRHARSARQATHLVDPMLQWASRVLPGAKPRNLSELDKQLNAQASSALAALQSPMFAPAPTQKNTGTHTDLPALVQRVIDTSKSVRQAGRHARMSNMLNNVLGNANGLPEIHRSDKR